MATSGIHHRLHLFSRNDVSWNIPPFDPVGVVDIRLRQRFQMKYRNLEGQVSVRCDQFVAPDFWVRIIVPFHVLHLPLCREHYVSNQLSRLHIDPSTRDFLTPHIVSFAVDAACNNNNNNVNGFLVVAHVEVTEVELVDEAEINRSVSSLLEAMAVRDGDSVRRGASKYAIEGLKKEKFDGGDGDVVSCVVCLEEFSAGTEYTRMPCHHVFHHGCIIQWLNKSNTCPTCRFVLED